MTTIPPTPLGSRGAQHGIWDDTIVVTPTEAQALTDVRSQFLAVTANETSELYSGVVELADGLLQIAESFVPAPAGILTKLGRAVLRRGTRQPFDESRTRNVVTQVWVRLLSPDQNYRMDISDVRLLCREICGNENYSIKLPDRIYDRVISNLQGGSLREYCNARGLGAYVNKKQRQVDIAYLYYKEGGTLGRLNLRPVGY